MLSNACLGERRPWRARLPRVLAVAPDGGTRDEASKGALALDDAELERARRDHNAWGDGGQLPPIPRYDGSLST